MIPFYVFFGGISGYLLAFLAITIHELSHYLVALIAGADGLTLLLTPYGATLEARGVFPHFGAVLIAGPFANVVLASFTLSACWIIPELYGYFKGFIVVNAVLAAVNLLPAYPLDGGRLFRLIFPYGWARTATRIATLLVGIGAYTIFFLSYRFTFLVFALFMSVSFVAPIIGRRNRCDEKEPLYVLARTDEEGRIRPATIKRGRRTLCRLSSTEVTSLLLSFPTGTSIRVALVEKGYK